jgi:Glycosyltransferase family 10 (fucosyltransferase) C-term
MSSSGVKLPLPRVLLIFLIAQLATVHLLHNRLDVVFEPTKTTIAAVTNQPEEAAAAAREPFASSKSTLERHVKYFNPWDMERFVCGKSIPANASATILVGGDDCPDDNAYTRVFQKDPTIHDKNVPSIMIHFLDKRNKNTPHDVDCDVPCAVWPTGNPTVRDPAKIDGTPFQLAAYSMEGSGIYKTLEIDPKAHQKYRYYATTSFQSEVPLSYYSPSMYNIPHPPVDFDSAIKGASFLARNCNSVSGREMLLRELIRHASSTEDFRIESLSACMRNALPPQGVDLKNKTEVLKSYLFHFSFENQKTPDYITEKLWGALESGTLPVYFGAPNIREHVPPRSIILVDDFPSTKDLVSYLIQVSNNKKLYYKYHEWRQQPLPKFFLDKYEFTKVHSYCRVCRFSYAMKYGYGWDHGRQQVQALRLPRGKTCLNEEGWMASPLQEAWILNNKEVRGEPASNDRRDCGMPAKTSSHIPGTSWRRTIWDHDLVTDLEITGLSLADAGTVLWQLHLPSNTTQVIRKEHPNRSNHDIFWIQDGLSRIVVVFNETVDWLDDNGQPSTLLRVRIHMPLRVRLIVEDVDTFHQYGTEKESYFSSFMTDEFMHPLKFEGA